MPQIKIDFTGKKAGCLQATFFTNLSIVTGSCYFSAGRFIFFIAIYAILTNRRTRRLFLILEGTYYQSFS